MKIRAAISILCISLTMLCFGRTMGADDVPRMATPKEVEEVVPGKVYRFVLYRFHADDNGGPNGARQWNEEVFMSNLMSFLSTHPNLRVTGIRSENNGDVRKMKYGSGKTTSYLIDTQVVDPSKRLPTGIFLFGTEYFGKGLKAFLNNNPKFEMICITEQRSGDYGAITGYYALFEYRQ